MFRRLSGHRPGPVRSVFIALLAAALGALWLVPTSAAEPDDVNTAQEQVLTWTGDNSVTDYASAPATATAGPATIVFENSTATGNTISMPHTLTFDTSNPDYNQDVDLNIFASPSDGNGGRHEVEVVLSPGEYRYYCDIPGHGQMWGVLVVTGDGGEDTTPPDVSAQVTGDQDGDGNYIGSATVTITAEDDDSGVDTIEYELNDTGFQPYTAPVVVDEPGDYAVQYRATDNAGNTSEVGSVSFTVVEQDPDDTTPPEVSAEVSGDQDADGNYVGAATVTITAEDDQSGVDTVEYNLNDTGWQDYTAPVTVNTPGEHLVEYRATDNAGNTSDVGSLAFTVIESEPGDCPGSDTRATVIIGTIDTTVPNVDTGNGCTINDLIDENGEYRNHGQFVRHVRHVTNALAADGHISGNERGRIMNAAARSDIGK
jgi:plastocyanin